MSQPHGSNAGMDRSGKTVTVIAAHAATYADPIRLDAGDEVTLTGRTEVWDGYAWHWACARDGRAGWVPEGLLEGDPPTAGRRYDARELTVEPGIRVAVPERLGGWSLVRDPTGAEGWIPDKCLASG